ncbi:hypothetical protein V6N13_000757 [Hibiscus sabdariffa]|uniref:Uncharacterized protein n=1 Tax=Hibiscus sabdariffa TaxID=183260 RepID=A0ABR2G6S8_9ROSI
MKQNKSQMKEKNKLTKQKEQNMGMGVNGILPCPKGKCINGLQLMLPYQHISFSEKELPILKQGEDDEAGLNGLCLAL